MVHRCVKVKTGEEFAVKSFQFEDEHLPNIKANFLHMKRLEHAHIARY